MPYTKTVWSDRVVSKPMTFTFQNNGDGTTTLVPAEGTITTAGTPIQSTTMNNLESQYDKAMSDVATLYLPLTGGGVTGAFSIVAGANANPFSVKNDNGQILFVNDTTENSIQSLIANGTGSRILAIEGLNGANLTTLTLRADLTSLGGALSTVDTVTITRASKNLIIKGTAVGTSSNAYIEIQDSAGTRQGWFGKGSPSDNTISINNDIGDISFNPAGGTKVIMLKNLEVAGTMQLNVGGLTSILGAGGFTHNTLKKATFKSWTLQHSASGDLVYYPSTVADGTTWDTTSAFTIANDGSFNAKILKENGTLLTSKYLQLTGGTVSTLTVTGATTLNGFTVGTLSNIDNRSRIPSIASDGVMEIGSVIDFHAGGSAVDYSARFTVDGTGKITASGVFNALNLQENAVYLYDKYLKLDGTNTLTGSVEFDVTTEKLISDLAVRWGFFINNTGTGLYDWTNNRSILSYTASTNAITMSGTVTMLNLVSGSVSKSWTALPPNNGGYFLDLKNSDVVGANGIHFSDTSDSVGEGFMWLKSTGTGGSQDKADYYNTRVDGTGNYRLEGNVIASVKAGTTLWTSAGGNHPVGSATLTPSIPLSECPNGWCLEWNIYPAGSTIKHYTYINKYGGPTSWHSFIIPHPSARTGTKSNYVTKIVSVTDTTISGHDDNGVAPNNAVALYNITAY